MRVVPVIEWERQAGLHVLFLDARGRIHGDRRLVPHAHDGVDVSGHMLGVADAGHQFGVGAAARERLLGLVVIPIMNAIMMRAGMVRARAPEFRG